MCSKVSFNMKSLEIHTAGTGIFNILVMRGFRKFCQKESNSDIFFLLVDNEGREDPNSIKSGPSSARQRNAILMAFR